MLEEIGPFDTVDDIAEANRADGGHWFDEETLAFFGTRFETSVLYGRYFVTSEQDPQGKAWSGERLFSVRRADALGRVRTVGQFGQWCLLEDAVKAAREAWEGE